MPTSDDKSGVTGAKNHFAVEAEKKIYSLRMKC